MTEVKEEMDMIKVNEDDKINDDDEEQPALMDAIDPMKAPA